MNTSKYGRKPKILLLTNPNDPLGVVISPEVMMASIHFARRRNMHVIVDEVYALSLHNVSVIYLKNV